VSPLVYNEDNPAGLTLRSAGWLSMQLRSITCVCV